MARTVAAFFNRAAVSQESGSERANAYLLSLTDAFTSDSNVFSLPVIKSANFKDETDTPSQQSASNDTYYLAGGKRSASVEVEFMQQDAATKNFSNTFRGESMFLVFEAHKLPVSGKKQVFIVPYAKVESKLNVATPGSSTKQNFMAMPSAALQTINLVSLTAGFHNTFTCTAYPVPKDSIIITYEE